MKNKFFAALMEQTVHKPSKKPLMKDYLMQWLSEKKPTLKDGTYKSYESLIKTELIPNLGSTSISTRSPARKFRSICSASWSKGKTERLRK